MKERGCSAEMANKIVSLLCSQSNILPVIQPPVSSAEAIRTGHRDSKCTTRIVKFILEQKCSVPKLITLVKDKFGIKIGQTTVYKIINGKHKHSDSPAQSNKPRRGINLEQANWVLSRRGRPVTEIQHDFLGKFGRCLSSNTIYQIWNGKHPVQNEANK